MKPTATVTVLALLALGLHPSRTTAQATNPAYVKEMPPVDRVLREISAADPDEAAARRMGAFLQFKGMINAMAGPRRANDQMTPDERRLIGMYFAAYWNIAQTKGEYQQPAGLKGYDSDPRYTDELLKKFFSASFRAQYESLNPDFARKLASAPNTPRSGQAAGGQAEGGGGDEKRQVRRCIESGRSEPQCMAEGIGNSAISLLGGNPLDLLKKGPTTGLRMGGDYPAPAKSNVGLTFYPNDVNLTCLDLEPAAHGYAVSVQGGQVFITIEALPRPLVFTVRPDQRLAGTGPVDLTGLVQVGVEHGTRTWSNGTTEPISRPVYQTFTRRCNAGVLTTSGSASPLGSVSSAGGTVLNLLMGSSDPQAGKTSSPGLGLIGEYGTQAGFDLDFKPDGVVVGCREATILRHYAVQLSGNQVLVKVEHGATPFAVALGPDGRLTGSGSVRVDGRLATGTANGEITFVPRSATCAMGILPPTGGTAAAGGVAPSGGAAPGSAGAAAGDAVLVVAVTFPPAAGPSGQMPSRSLLLLNDDLVTVLTQGGFQAAPGKSLLRTLATCQAGDANCQKGSGAIVGHVVAQARTDATGKAFFPGVAAGTYYLMVTATSKGEPILWHLKLQLKPGENAIVLDQRNTTAIP